MSLFSMPQAHPNGQTYIDSLHAHTRLRHGGYYTHSRDGSAYLNQPGSHAQSAFPPDAALQAGAQTPEGEPDSSKLKGTIYPGMGLFDAATAEQRRMRNQRKDGSVLEQMKIASASVVPNELVWTEDIEFQRVRDIYATPSVEGSPVSTPSKSLALSR